MNNEEEMELTEEENKLNENIYIIMGNETGPFSISVLAQKLGQKKDRIKKSLLLFEQEHEAEKVEKDGKNFWQLTQLGKSTAWMLQDIYLNGNESYQPKQLTQDNLTSEHIALLEYFEGPVMKSPKSLPPDVFRAHRAKDNHLCLEYPLLADMLESHLISHDRETGFQNFYFTGVGKKILKRIQGYSLAWNQLSLYQKEVLRVLKGSSYEQPKAYYKIMDNLESIFNISLNGMNRQMSQLECANLMEHSDIMEEDCNSFYITTQGSQLLKNNDK